MNKTLIFITSILMWGANLSAAPVFTDIEPDTTIAADVGVILSYYIDFNGDGEDELELCHFYGDDSWNNIEAYSAGQHCEICAGQWSGPVIMNKDDKISSKNSWVCTNSGSSNSALFMNPDWLGVVDKYMGIRFKVDGNWHYAWVVLDVFADNSGFTVKEYAYESEPGTAISAGDRGASSVIRDFPANIKICNTGAQFIISGDNELRNFDIKIYTFDGRLILEQEAGNGCAVINYSNFKPGVYFICLFSGQKAYIRKILF